MPFHILTAAFVHESNTFKRGETTLQDFRNDVLDEGQTAIDRFGDVNEKLAGFLDIGREAGWQITPAAALQARDFDASKGPLIIADYADNPGAGAYGDATALLQALLDAGATGGAFAPIIDAEAASILHRHIVGDHVTLALGGKQDPSFGGGPLHLTGELIHLSDGSYTGDGPILGGITHSFGPTAVFRVQGIDILVVTQPGQMLDLMQVRTFGVEPAALRFLVVKSMQHLRAAFQPISGKVIVCDSEALAAPQAHLRPYTRVRRPVWPLDRTGFGVA